MDDFDPDWMWERARALLEKTERRPNPFASGPSVGRATWEPPTDVFETPSDYWVLVALPGVDPRGVEVELRGNQVRIRAERPQPEALRRAKVHRLEIPYGRFERHIQLPDGTYRLGTTRMGHGCAVLQIKKTRRTTRGR